MCPAQSRQSPAPCDPTCGPRHTGDEAATTALLLVAVGDVGLVPTSGPLTGLEMEMARTPCCCCCCPASAQMQLPSTQLNRMGHRLSGGDRWGEGWSKINHGMVMISKNVPFIYVYHTLQKNTYYYKEQSVEKVRIKIYLRITKVQYNLITNEY